MKRMERVVLQCQSEMFRNTAFNFPVSLWTIKSVCVCVCLEPGIWLTESQHIWIHSATQQQGLSTGVHQPSGSLRYSEHESVFLFSWSNENEAWKRCSETLVIFDKKTRKFLSIQQSKLGKAVIRSGKYCRAFLWSVASLDNELLSFDVWACVCLCVCLFTPHSPLCLIVFYATGCCLLTLFFPLLIQCLCAAHFLSLSFTGGE